MTSTVWVLRWFCGEFSPPAARLTGHQPQCMKTSIQSEFSFERFLEVQLNLSWFLVEGEPSDVSAWMCRRASLWATASNLHVNDLNPFSGTGQINQSDRCCGPHDAAVRAFCSVVTCLCQSLAPDIFAVLLWDSERCRCVQQRLFHLWQSLIIFFCYEWTKEKNSPKQLDSGRWTAHSPAFWQQRPSFWWNSGFEAHLLIT